MGWSDEKCERRDRSRLSDGEPDVVRALAQIPSNDNTENHSQFQTFQVVVNTG